MSVGKGRHPEQKAQRRGRQRGVKLKFMNITRFGCMDGGGGVSAVEAGVIAKPLTAVLWLKEESVCSRAKRALD